MVNNCAKYIALAKTRLRHDLLPLTLRPLAIDMPSSGQ